MDIGITASQNIFEFFCQNLRAYNTDAVSRGGILDRSWQFPVRPRKNRHWYTIGMHVVTSARLCAVIRKFASKIQGVLE